MNKKYYNIFGQINIWLSLYMLLPVIAVSIYSEWQFALCFIIPAAISLLLGIILYFSFKENINIELDKKQSIMLVFINWIYVIFLSSIPFIISGYLDFTRAFFEATSGWTTTGLSVLDVTTLPKCLLLWRSLMQFAGGIGIVFIMLISFSNMNTSLLYQAEGHSDKIYPNLKKTIFSVMLIYLSYTFIGIVAYVIADMPLFDAINHSMAALSTGGFSVKVGSIGEYNSVAIEIITEILMLLGAINFATHILFITGKFSKLNKILELRFILVSIIISAIVLIFIGFNDNVNIPSNIRSGVFEAVSAVTTTGFNISNYSVISSFSIFFIICLMLIGGNSGSTAGGIKSYRVGLKLKSIFGGIRDYFHPNNLINAKYIYTSSGKYYVDDIYLNRNSNFIGLYVLTWLIGGLIISAHGYSMQDSLFEFASCLGTVGLSIGLTSAALPDSILWLETIGMLLGRLEFVVIIMPIYQLITKGIKLLLKR